MSESDEPHLSQKTPQIHESLGRLSHRLKAASFAGAGKGVVKCTDKDLPNACEPLFSELGFGGDRVKLITSVFHNKR